MVVFHALRLAHRSTSHGWIEHPQNCGKNAAQSMSACGGTRTPTPGSNRPSLLLWSYASMCRYGEPRFVVVDHRLSAACCGDGEAENRTPKSYLQGRRVTTSTTSPNAALFPQAPDSPCGCGGDRVRLQQLSTGSVFCSPYGQGHRDKPSRLRCGSLNIALRQAPHVSLPPLHLGLTWSRVSSQLSRSREATSGSRESRTPDSAKLAPFTEVRRFPAAASDPLFV